MTLCHILPERRGWVNRIRRSMLSRICVHNLRPNWNVATSWRLALPKAALWKKHFTCCFASVLDDCDRYWVRLLAHNKKCLFSVMSNLGLSFLNLSCCIMHCWCSVLFQRHYLHLIGSTEKCLRVIQTHWIFSNVWREWCSCSPCLVVYSGLDLSATRVLFLGVLKHNDLDGQDYFCTTRLNEFEALLAFCSGNGNWQSCV